MQVYIYILSSTDCFLVSHLFSMARHVGRLKLRLKPAKTTLVLVSYRPASKRITSAQKTPTKSSYATRRSAQYTKESEI